MDQRKILVVDDEKNIRMTLATCLESGGFLVETAVNGEEAIFQTRKLKYDLVFLDMKMPGMDGITVLRHLKERYPELNVIMMTAYGTIETAVEAMKLGAVDYLRKPFSPNEVMGIAGAIFERDALDSSTLNDYGSIIEYAKSQIVKQDFVQAREWIKKAISIDPSQPSGFNLFGVMLEMDQEILEAQKMYRAALALDPSYTPANDNLHRTVQWNYQRDGINLGENTEPK